MSAFETPRRPEFESVEAERLHGKQRLAATFRLFGKLGYNEGVAGHVTYRDPERTDLFWVNGFGQSFSQVRVSDLILVDHEGNVVEGRARVNRAAFVIHAAVHAARPDVIAAAHTHSVHGRAFSSLGRRLDPISQDACAFHGDHGVFEDYTGLVWKATEAERMVEALGDNKACILQNHGLLTVAKTVDAAAFWYISMETCCQVQLMAEAAGTPRLIREDEAQKTFEQIGGEGSGWFSFQPLYDQIVREQPDLLD